MSLAVLQPASSQVWTGHRQRLGPHPEAHTSLLPEGWPGHSMSQFFRPCPLFAPLEQAGYKIAIVLVDNFPAIAKQRSHVRFLREGRYASDRYIEARAP